MLLASISKVFGLRLSRQRQPPRAAAQQHPSCRRMHYGTVPTRCSSCECGTECPPRQGVTRRTISRRAAENGFSSVPSCVRCAEHGGGLVGVSRHDTLRRPMRWVGMAVVARRGRGDVALRAAEYLEETGGEGQGPSPRSCYPALGIPRGGKSCAMYVCSRPRTVWRSSRPAWVSA